MKKSLIIIVCLALFGCGFHLRNETQFPEALYNLYLESTLPNGPLTLELKQLLESVHVNLASDPEHAPYTVKIFGEIFTSTVLSKSASSNTRQYVLQYTVQFELINSKGVVIFGPRILTSKRNYTVNQNQVLSTSTEQETLRNEMQHDMVFRILTQLSSEQVVHLVSGPVPK